MERPWLKPDSTTPPRIWWPIVLLTTLNLLDYFDRYIVAAVSSLVQAELQLSEKAYGFLGSTFFLVYLATAPLFGFLGDRYGRRPLLAGGAALWSVATSLAAWVKSYPTLLAARGLVGVGEASFGTLAPAYLADLLPLASRGRVLGLFYATIPLGAALAYYLGGKIGAAWGWRTAFLLAGLPGLVLAALIWTLPPSAPAPGPQPAQWSKIMELLRIPTFLRVTVGYGFLTFALGGLAFWMPRFLEQTKGISLKDANLIIAGATTLAGTLGTLSGGLVGDWLFRYNRRAHLLVSGVGVALALPFGAAVIFSPSPVVYQSTLYLAVFLLFLNPGLLTTLIVSVAGPGRRAVAIAVNIIVIHLLGDVPSPFLIGWLADVAGLQWGVSLALVALTLSAVILLSGLKQVSVDLAREI